MSKKILIGIIIVLVVIGGIEIIAGLGKENKKEETTETAKKEDVFYFQDGEKTAYLGETFEKSAFGEEEEYSEVASCAFDGLDKTYTYANYEITTFPDGDKEKVLTVYFLNETIATKEGLKVSDEKSKMIELYGEDYESQGNQCTYTKGKTSLEIIVENDVVTSIQYSFITE